MKRLGVLFAVLAILFTFSCGGGGGGSSDKDKDPCASPVPCLTEKWGYIDESWEWHGDFAIFYNGADAIVLISNGETIAVASTYEIEGDICYVVLAGPVLNCHDASVITGAIDYDLDGIPDYEFTSAAGNLMICGETITIFGIIIEGDLYKSVTGIFDSMGALSLSNHLGTNAPITSESIDEVKIKVGLLEQSIL